MHRKSIIVYLGSYSFPNGGAAARRILGNAHCLRVSGYEVIITSGQEAEEGQQQTMPVESQYKGFRVISLGERTAEKYPEFLKQLIYFKIGVKTIQWLESLEYKPDVIILYSGYSPYMMRLIPWCKKWGVKFIFDAVEWYDPKNFISGLFSPYQLNIELALRYYSKKTARVITISRYLQKHYDSQGCNTIRIPPTLETEQIKPNLNVSLDNGILVLSYTGTPGNKDLFNTYLEAVLRMYDQGEKVLFRFAGVREEQLFKYPALVRRKINNVLPMVLDCRGVTSHEEAIAITKMSDFSLLLRRPERYAQAGFSTKVVESLSVGTPVIINITSDLGDYIHDGIEGLISEDYTPESLVQALKRAMALSKEEKILMRKAARRQAELSFDCYQYSQRLKTFIET